MSKIEKLNICFVSPHPDDVELYCGGTLLDYEKKNASLSVIMMTKGGHGSRNPFLRGKPLEHIREQEARARYRLLDDLNLIFAGFKDANVIHDHASIQKITDVLKELKPDIIYLPEFVSKLSERRHSDHINTGKIIFDASQRLHRSVSLRCYHSKLINYIHKIDDYFEKNNEAIQLYKSQRGKSLGPFKSGLMRLNHRYNKKRSRWGKEIGAHYAEGFREIVHPG